MIQANDIASRRNEIKDFVANAEIRSAVKRLIDFLRDFYAAMEDEAVLLSMEYTELEREERMRLEQREDLKLTKRQIAQRVLLTLNVAYEASAKQTFI